MPNGDAMRRVQDALAARGAQVNASGRVACPAHGGDDPNLAVTQGKSGVVVFCHSHGCTADAIAAALGLEPASLFDDWAEQADRSRGARGVDGVRRTEYVYRAEDGSPLFRVVRSDFSDGREKKVWQERYDSSSGEFVAATGGMKGVRRVLYRLPEVRATMERGAIVYVTEGEKAADALREAFGVCTTTASGGAGKWLHKDAVPPYAESLRGAKVVLLPDADEPGEAHMRTAAEALYGVAGAVKIVRCPNLPDKGDIVEWLEGGGSIEELNDLRARERPFVPGSAPQRNAVAAPQWRATLGMDAFDDDAFGGAETPQLEPASLYGVLGDVVRLIEPHTEAAPAGILVSLVVSLGCLIGRGPYQMLDGARHGCNLFALLVGPSSSGRKGTAADRARSILREVDEDFDRRNIASGLSSGQGLIENIRDPLVASATPRPEGKPGVGKEDTGVADKRLLVIESEIASAFRQMDAKGNTLSATLRQAWDSHTLRTLTALNPRTATDPHVSILGQITPDELCSTLNDHEFKNGLLNRFLFVYTEREKELPFGGTPPAHAISPLIRKLRSGVDFARRVGEVTLAEDARDRWAAEYSGLTTGAPGRAGDATRRGAPIVRRLAMLFALLDESREINDRHLEAALALWRSSLASARFVFGEVPLSPMASKFLEALFEARSAGLDRSQIRTIAGGGSVQSAAILKALKDLQSAGVVRMVKERTPGRPREVWRHVRFALSAPLQSSTPENKVERVSNPLAHPDSSPFPPFSTKTTAVEKPETEKAIALHPIATINPSAHDVSAGNDGYFSGTYGEHEAA